MAGKKHKLTKTQETGAISRSLKGWSQQKIAKSLGVAKWRVNAYLVSKKVGKRRKSEFWGSVKAVQEATGYSWVKVRKTVYHAPKWSEKRATRMGKRFKSWREFWDECKQEGLSQEEKMAKMEEMEDEVYFDTPL